MNSMGRFYHWLHGRWPAGKVEPLPISDESGRTRLPGVYIVGDLSRIPLFKMSLRSGVGAVRQAEERIAKAEPEGEVDVCIVGAGVAGVAAACECQERGLSYRLLESNQVFSTVVNFPKGKPIYTYPTEMDPPGKLRVEGEAKEDLLENLQRQVEDYGIEVTEGNVTHIERSGKRLLAHLAEGEAVAAKTIVIAIGRSGKYRRLGVPGEDLDKVSNRLLDPAKHRGRRVLVVGGGDSALESAIALAEENEAGEEALVSLSYRRAEFSRPKPGNRERIDALVDAGRLRLLMPSTVVEIQPDEVVLETDDHETTIPNDQVFAMIGREPPLVFFRRSGLPIFGERPWWSWAAMAIFVALIGLIYGMKNYGWFSGWPFDPGRLGRGLAGMVGDPRSLLGTVADSAGSTGFWVTLLYSVAVTAFGIDRMRRRATAYVRVQTLTLMAIQILPLFLLPEIILPWLGNNGAFDAGSGRWLADRFFPMAEAGREYWRAYGFVLAWPLMVWNVFTEAPLYGWLVVSLLQTAIIIPLIIWRWGKGAYCGWICSCGALAETMGDRHREKMPHGPGWNRLNMAGQVLLWLAGLFLLWRVLGWLTGPEHWLAGSLDQGLHVFWRPVVDWLLAGVLGIGLYFWFSGRVWCRFFCPLAALMHIYTRFSRYRILVDQKKCINCNQCTMVCHQGIDVMNFANKGRHMEDPECVRCSACVQACPTNVLSFGRVDADGRPLARDPLPAREAGRD